MLVKLQSTGLRRTRWYEYVSRFIFGGTATVLAGLVTKQFGPDIGGLFLAFPVIFPASASLIERHERQRKRRAGLDGTNRGRLAAGVDAAGAAMGCIGLIGFAAVSWKLLPAFSTLITLTVATSVWALVAGTIWIVRKRVLHHRGQNRVSKPAK